MSDTIYTLKAAVRSLVTRAGGNTRCAEAINAQGLGGRVTPSRLTDVGSPAEDKLGHHLNLAQIAILEAEAAYPVVAATLAEMQGYRLIPQGQEPNGALASQLLSLVAGLGVLSEAAGTGEEGERSINELSRILSAGEKLAEQITVLNADVRQRLASKQEDLT